MTLNRWAHFELLLFKEDVYKHYQTCFFFLPKVQRICFPLGSVSGPCSFQNGLCGFQNGINNEFQWTTETRGTLSEGTGPSFDHTTLSDQGVVFLYLIFIDIYIYIWIRIIIDRKIFHIWNLRKSSEFLEHYYSKKIRVRFKEDSALAKQENSQDLKQVLCQQIDVYFNPKVIAYFLPLES